MSNKLMDTEPGGEQTPYEAENSDVLPHKKESGQFGSNPTPTNTSTQLADKTPTTSSSTTDKNAPNTQNITPTDKKLYGQSIQASGGGGGQTVGLEGKVDSEEGVGEDGVKERRAQGYGGDKDVGRDVGA